MPRGVFSHQLPQAITHNAREHRAVALGEPNIIEPVENIIAVEICGPGTVIEIRDPGRAPDALDFVAAASAEYLCHQLLTDNLPDGQFNEHSESPIISSLEGAATELVCRSDALRQIFRVGQGQAARGRDVRAFCPGSGRHLGGCPRTLLAANDASSDHHPGENRRISGKQQAAVAEDS